MHAGKFSFAKLLIIRAETRLSDNFLLLIRLLPIDDPRRHENTSEAIQLCEVRTWREIAAIQIWRISVSSCYPQ